MLEIKKLYWVDIREDIKELNPIFFSLVDKLAPGKDLPMYIVDYGYGDLVGDDEGIFLPRNGEYIRLSSAYVPSDMLNDLAYGLNNSPLGMFYDKSFEWFLSTTDENVNRAFPIFIDKPGSFFSIGHILNYGYTATHLPNGVLYLTAGSRSNFMIPKISCGVMHSRIKKSLNLMSSAPSSYYEHAEIFKDIVKSSINNNWKSSILYFSQNWIKQISQDSAWQGIRDYFFRVSNQRSEYFINSDYYNHVYRITNKRNNLKSNILIYETARHLFEISLGVKLGYTPAVDDQLLPLKLIQEIYTECYRLDYTPIIAVPDYYDYENPKPVYYSLHYPSLCSYSPKARNASTTLSDLIALIDVVKKYQKDFSLPIKECKNTILEKVSHKTQFNYYHPISDNKHINSSEEIAFEDDRFGCVEKFPASASFFKGCISVSPKTIQPSSIE